MQKKNLRLWAFRFVIQVVIVIIIIIIELVLYKPILMNQTEKIDNQSNRQRHGWRGKQIDRQTTVRTDAVHTCHFRTTEIKIECNTTTLKSILYLLRKSKESFVKHSCLSMITMSCSCDNFQLSGGSKTAKSIK